ncbi:MAG TPA: class I SAM-dependent methyltransferase [Tepidisphaeraceae bacterium]|nr:class I SAM-dependent methyltransferase [Tepidisphaeraceae bacterium]
MPPSTALKQPSGVAVDFWEAFVAEQYQHYIGHFRRTVDFILPNSVYVLVASHGDPSLLQLGRRLAQHFPQNEHAQFSGEPASDDEVIAQLEARREAGAHYLAIPGPQLWWMEEYRGLRAHLESRYRCVLNKPQQCLIYALREDPGAQPDLRVGPDGLPVPPPELIHLISAQYNFDKFFRNGAKGAECIRQNLALGGTPLSSHRRVLDFGCGCGRILRHWRKEAETVHFVGTDYNPVLVEWTRNAFPELEILRNETDLKLPFHNDEFDLIYAISVFTHLDEDRQQFWMNELRRVLRPGGTLLITVHGTSRRYQMKPEQWEAFQAGRMSINFPDATHSNLCSVFHPESYIREVLARDMEVLSFIPQGAKDADQDAYVLRKPETTRE